ncbi:MAG: DUF4445 domain-containing protein [Dethiobacter sp.]|jgi:uncharacterized 2Fe-2S/4Fe-4S cluster protein (DUF4445 family)|nr:DUF4445 domain-containing protein [Dethiobacter sp.]
MYSIKFLPENKTVVVEDGTTLLMAAVRAGVTLDADCGGKGTCGRCRVKILAGDLSDTGPMEFKHLSVDERSQGWELACKRVPDSDLLVEVRQQENALERKITLSSTGDVNINPAVSKVLVELTPPTLSDSTSDFERLLDGLTDVKRAAELRVLRNLPQVLREENFTATAVLHGETLLAVEAGNSTGRIFGLAVDIGTTTLAASLLDLANGKVLATLAATNPQQSFGADVISRINYAARSHQGLIQLQESVILALNALFARLTEMTGVSIEEIYEMVVVGNTTMSHLFLGVDPTYLASAPFIPAFTETVQVEAERLGLAINSGGRIVVLPNVAGYVGSDTVGVMLATGMDRVEGVRLAVDVGTNGEIVLAGNGRILTCSTAAGPAFEGAQIKYGMRAAHGAIEAVSIEGDSITMATIGGSNPVGICGSGLIDAVAAMLKAGIIDHKGRMVRPDDKNSLPAALRVRLNLGDEGPEFILSPQVAITQKDIRELQLAKGAIHAGVQVLLRNLGLSTADISEILLAGAFGNYVKKESALAIGLLPSVPLGNIISVGNAAGDGACQALFSIRERARALALAKAAEHVELSAREDFQEEFINSLNFPEQA